MDLILLRHGKAEDNNPAGDGSRALTGKGLLQAEQQAERLKQAGLLPGIVLTSPVLRARQTADAFCAAANLPGPLTQGWIACGMQPETAIRELAGFSEFQRVAIVGHEPDLSRLLAHLLQMPGPSIKMKKGAMACLKFEPPSQRATLKYLIPPI